VTMTKTERAELSGIVKRNHRVANAAVTQRKADLMGDFEAAMARQWKADDEAWADAVETARKAVAEANRAIAERFEELGLPEEIAPSMVAGWADRGENAKAQRRAELRRVAQSRAEAEAQRAKLELDRSEADLLTRLSVSALTSEEACSFLAQVPSVEALMPAIDVEELPAVVEAAVEAAKEAKRAERARWAALL